MVLSLDADPYEPGWDADTGDNWNRERFGPNEAPGTYTVRVARRDSGQTFTLTFTVDIARFNGGRDVRMTVRDVTITPVQGD